MKLLDRTIQTQIDSYLANASHNILFIWGPRRSGKTTLITQLASKLHVPIFTFDSLADQAKFIPNATVLKNITSAVPVVLIDEIHQYPEATVALKIIHDQLGVKVIATGSSELRQKATHRFDSLAGRYTEIFCLPLAYQEIASNAAPPAYEETAFYTQLAENTQKFGSYPEIYLSQAKPENETISVLERLVDAYVVKDVVNIYQLKNAQLAKNVLTKIALQIGSEVSIREIANSLQTNPATVANYIEIFIKNYILVPLPSFKSNLRRAISQNRKLYFLDLGVRNALVRDFRETPLRPDRGGLFENFVVAEIEKLRRIHNLKWNLYFYREYSGKEVDIVIEDYHKRYTCVEVKVSSRRPASRPVFPLPHDLQSLHASNYWRTLETLVSQAI